MDFNGNTSIVNVLLTEHLSAKQQPRYNGKLAVLRMAFLILKQDERLKCIFKQHGFEAAYAPSGSQKNIQPEVQKTKSLMTNRRSHQSSRIPKRQPSVSKTSEKISATPSELLDLLEKSTPSKTLFKNCAQNLQNLESLQNGAEISNVQNYIEPQSKRIKINHPHQIQVQGPYGPQLCYIQKYPQEEPHQISPNNSSESELFISEEDSLGPNSQNNPNFEESETILPQGPLTYYYNPEPEPEPESSYDSTYAQIDQHPQQTPPNNSESELFICQDNSRGPNTRSNPNSSHHSTYAQIKQLSTNNINYSTRFISALDLCQQQQQPIYSPVSPYSEENNSNSPNSNYNHRKSESEISNYYYYYSEQSQVSSTNSESDLFICEENSSDASQNIPGQIQISHNFQNHSSPELFICEEDSSDGASSVHEIPIDLRKTGKNSLPKVRNSLSFFNGLVGIYNKRRSSYKNLSVVVPFEESRFKLIEAIGVILSKYGHNISFTDEQWLDVLLEQNVPVNVIDEVRNDILLENKTKRKSRRH